MLCETTSKRPCAESNPAEPAVKETPVSPHSSISSTGDIEDGDIQQEFFTAQKKRYRLSKKDVPVYKWTDESIKNVAKFVQDCPTLYDRRQKDWQNVFAKSQLWAKIGEQQDPPATGPQCKKLYENMRTRVGKILNREKRTGASEADRTIRNQEIMGAWSFLTQHIIKTKTTANEEVSSCRFI